MLIVRPQVLYFQWCGTFQLRYIAEESVMLLPYVAQYL